VCHLKILRQTYDLFNNYRVRYNDDTIDVLYKHHIPVVQNATPQKH